MVGEQFEEKVWMLGAKLCKGFISHRTNGQHRGQLCLVNRKRHIL